MVRKSARKVRPRPRFFFFFFFLPFRPRLSTACRRRCRLRSGCSSNDRKSSSVIGTLSCTGRPSAATLHVKGFLHPRADGRISPADQHEIGISRQDGRAQQELCASTLFFTAVSLSLQNCSKVFEN